MRLGHQCPFSHWFRRECTQLATALCAEFQDIDLTGRPDLASTFGAYSSAQLVAPDMPPLAAPSRHAAIVETLSRPLPAGSWPSKPPPPASPPGCVYAYAPGDARVWREAVAQTVKLCLGCSAAAAYQDEAVELKIAWLEGLASDSSWPLVFLAGDPQRPSAFLEMIPVAASHVPVPHVLPGDLFVTCVAGRSGEQDARPWLLEGAQAWLAGRFAGSSVHPTLWAVSGRNASYPNGPAWLFGGAGFAEVAGLGRILPGREWDDMILVRWQPGTTQQNPIGLLLQRDDNVATLPLGCAAGETVLIRAEDGDFRLTAIDPIPAGHKMAVRPTASGEAVQKYGEVIGRFRSAVVPGEHVHVHNMLSARAGGGSR
jgi:altronate dehydratase small subunit